MVTGGLVQTATGVSTHVYNGGVSGYSTQDFLDDKSDCYTNVVTNATRLSQNGGRLYFSIQLGTNDSKRNSTKERYSKATYKANLEALIANLTTQFPDCKIILNYPPWYSANTYTDASEFTEEGQQLLHSYYDVIDEVAAANDKVFAGDRNTWDVFEDRTDLYSPETSVNAVGEYYLHPNAEGASRLAMIWTKGILPVVESDGISATTAATVRQGLTAGNYGTICLPQEVTDATGATFYKVASKTIKEGDIKFISLEEVNELTAGEAYIYQATADKIDVTYISNYEVKTPVAATKSGTGVTGVFTRTAIPVGYYMVKNNLIYLVDVADWAFAGANKGWLELDGIAEDNGSAGSHRVIMFVDNDDDPTGLDNSEQRIENNSQTSNLKPQTIYDLQGRKVTQPQKGHIYLINGKKVTVK